ncbi:hypothetical protein FHS32_006587 [Streptomyces albaduncus]|uniref:Uncharacterized protein n=1 Tax=Streptomyces griseoloalbus TaxID=67303 RepID=A0A7W8BX36_9ACTN|nr:hypothetical protein [Streptomyces albaduncus]
MGEVDDPAGDDDPNPPYDPPAGTTWPEWHDVHPDTA